MTAADRGGTWPARRPRSSTRRVLVVDECRRTGSVSKALLAGA
ncbi:hypothetical protein [Halomonas sp. A11-A]|nr:hypothetical protein [Halomonas sp. A11-A]